MSEALRLAELLEDEVGVVEPTRAAAELRRLHELEKHHKEINDRLHIDIERLQAVNKELLEALSFVIRGVPDTWEGVTKARAAIAKAQEEEK